MQQKRRLYLIPRDRKWNSTKTWGRAGKCVQFHSDGITTIWTGTSCICACTWHCIHPHRYSDIAFAMPRRCNRNSYVGHETGSGNRSGNNFSNRNRWRSNSNGYPHISTTPDLDMTLSTRPDVVQHRKFECRPPKPEVETGK